MNDLLNVSARKLNSMKIVEWGYSQEHLPLTAKYYDDWVANNLYGPLKYMADERKLKRDNLKNYFDQFESALVFLFDYSTAAKKNIEEQDFQFASYTKGFEGFDYHYWIKEKLEILAQELKLERDFDYTFTIDAQPVLERDLAYKSGLGWYGKNSMLINQEHGSFFLIAGILLNKKLPLQTNALAIDHCGTCTRCIDACPTNAIIDNKVIDAKKCISTYTIELFKEADAPAGYPTTTSEIFGCDICQVVCPWNAKPLKNIESSDIVFWEEFFSRSTSEIIADLEPMSNREFKRKFKGTALERTGRPGLLKNLNKLKP